MAQMGSDRALGADGRRQLPWWLSRRAPIAARIAAAVEPAVEAAVRLTLLAAACAAILACFAPATVAAAQRHVAVLPLRAVVGRPADLFAPERPVPHLAEAAAVEARLVAEIQRHGDVRLLTPVAVRGRFAGDHSGATTARIASERYRLGLEYYHGLAPTRAADSLRASARLYVEIYQDLIGAKALADAYFMLGVTLHDGGNPVAAHVAFKEAFALAPTRRFRPRFFAPQVESALSAALIDHLATGNHARPYGEVERLGAICDRLDVDALVTVTLVDRGEGPLEVLVAAYRGSRGGVEAEARFPLAEVEAQLEPFLSRWMACLPVRQPAAAQRPTPVTAIRIDTSAAYALYLRQPTRRTFHSVGFAAGASGRLRPGLEWHGRITMDTSLSDPYRDLLRAFNSVRLVAGIGFALQRGRWHLALQPGLDVRLLGSFVATTDPDCKLFGEDHRLCDRNTVSDLGSTVLIGPSIGAALSVELGRSFLLRIATAATAYILPFDGTEELNYPISTEFGLGYRF